jgi:hypothetical protein
LSRNSARHFKKATIMSKLVAKLSVKAVAGKISPVAEDADAVHIADFVGIADGQKTVQTVFGNAVEFQGNFSGASAKTGEEFRARKMFLPNIAAELLTDAMAKAGDGVPVEFGFRIIVVHAKDKKSGADTYQYITEPLFENRETDPLAALLEKAKKTLSELPVLTVTAVEKPAPAKKK